MVYCQINLLPLVSYGGLQVDVIAGLNFIRYLISPEEGKGIRQIVQSIQRYWETESDSQEEAAVPPKVWLYNAILFPLPAFTRGEHVLCMAKLYSDYSSQGRHAPDHDEMPPAEK